MIRITRFIRRRLILAACAAAMLGAGIPAAVISTAAPASASIPMLCNAHDSVQSPCLYQGTATGNTLGVVHGSGSPAGDPCKDNPCSSVTSTWPFSQTWIDNYYQGKLVIYVKFSSYANVCEGFNVGATCGADFTVYVLSGQDQLVNVRYSDETNSRICISSNGYGAQVEFVGCDASQWPQIWTEAFR